MQSSISSKHLTLLQQHQFANFEQIWGYQGDWFESPNRERGGWSGVNFIELVNDANEKLGFYLKRQEGHLRRSWRNPVTGEPTFLREFEIMQHLKKYAVATPMLVFFAYKQKQAILLTEALKDYVSFEQWLKNNQGVRTKVSMKKLITALAQEVRKMHQAGVQHRSLYTKHMFIHESNGSFKIALIDFEKSRITSFISLLKFSDLITLNYRTQNLSRTYRLHFFKQYFGIECLTYWHKWLCLYIEKKSQKKIKST